MMDERAFDDETLDELFTYHAPDEEQRYRYERFRDAAKVFARELVRCVPQSADRTDAVRKLRECVMTGNAAIALEKARGR